MVDATNGIDEKKLINAFGGGSQLVLNSPGSMDRNLDIDEPASDWYWCLHCERAYPDGCYRQMTTLQMCPYAGCTGDSVIDAWPWQDYAAQHGIVLDLPVLGKRYPT